MPKIRKAEDTIVRPATRIRTNFEFPNYFIAAALRHDFFLRRVLEKLMDDGPQEYRLVSKRWNELVKEMPHSITLPNGVSADSAIESFPMASSVNCWRYYPRKIDTDADSTSISRSFRKDLETLSSMKCLLHLSLHLSGTSNAIQFLPDALLEMRKLKTLKIISRQSQKLNDEILRAIEKLRELKDLELMLQPSERLRPVEGLIGVRRLSISCSLVSDNSCQLLFPSLRELTDLSLDAHRVDKIYFRFKALRIYAPTLKSLRVEGLNKTRSVSPICFEFLSEFPVLQSIYLDVSFQKIKKFLLVIGRMTWIKHLGFTSVLNLPQSVRDSILNLTNLETLVVLGMPDRRLIQEVSQFSRLCLLRLKTFPIGLKPCWTAQGVKVELELSDREAFERAMYSGPQITSLSLRAVDSVVYGVEIAAFSNLEDLHLECQRVDSHFIEPLESLSKLTSLSLSLGRGADCSFLFRITALSNLVKLSLMGLLGTVHPCTYLPHGCFPNLKYLEIGLSPLPVDLCDELRTRLKSLRRVSCSCWESTK